MQVFFTIGLAVLLTGDRLSRANIVGGAIAGLGIAELAIYKLVGGMTGPLVGVTPVTSDGFAWGGGNITPKKAGAHYGRDLSGWRGGDGVWLRAHRGRGKRKGEGRWRPAPGSRFAS